MKVTVVGSFADNTPLFSTEKATALYIDKDDGSPALIIQMLPNGRGYVEYQKGKDAVFDALATQLKLT